MQVFAVINCLFCPSSGVLYSVLLYPSIFDSWFGPRQPQVAWFVECYFDVLDGERGYMLQRGHKCI